MSWITLKFLHCKYCFSLFMQSNIPKKLHLVQFKDYPQISTFCISSYISFCNSNILKKERVAQFKDYPQLLQFKYPLFLYFYNSECFKKGQKYSKFVPTFCSSNIPSPFSAVESNIGLLRKQAIRKSNETKKYHSTI